MCGSIVKTNLHNISLEQKKTFFQYCLYATEYRTIKASKATKNYLEQPNVSVRYVI